MAYYIFDTLLRDNATLNRAKIEQLKVHLLFLLNKVLLFWLESLSNFTMINFRDTPQIYLKKHLRIEKQHEFA